MSLRDLDPEGIIRHEDLVGIKMIEEWYIEKQVREAGRQRAKSRAHKSR